MAQAYINSMLIIKYFNTFHHTLPRVQRTSLCAILYPTPHDIAKGNFLLKAD